MTDVATREKLVDALRKSATRELSTEEVRRQRVSYVMGSVRKESGITRERVNDLLAQQDGRKKARSFLR